MHKIISGDQYADICVIECVSGYLKARVSRGTLPVSRLKQLIVNEDAIFWVKGIFENEKESVIQPYAWAETAEEAENKEYSEDIWVDLAKAGLVIGFDPNILQAALDAQRKLHEAQAEYQKTLESLGAVQKEEGTYEDYQEWLELPGCPMIRF